MTCHIYLGLIRGEAHGRTLQELADWLNDNKTFSCTLCTKNARAMLIVTAPDNWEQQSADAFYQYALEITLHALVRQIGDTP